ncbi:MAG: serine/threonine-protein phosphatase [Deltaproteobacteria bacterium]|nr:MAG: serine/threonine-protein phosphatase [Deltaproteobacteria bacterium]
MGTTLNFGRRFTDIMTWENFNMGGLLRKLFGMSRRNISSAGKTDTGRVRSHNEDSFCILPDRNIFLVADGMGGHNAGEVASQAAIETLNHYFSRNAVRKVRGNQEEIRHFLIKGLHHANDTVMEMAREDQSRHGMGCTLVTGMIDGNVLHTCHVGDARCYIADAQGITQLTVDHSAIAAYREKAGSGEETDPERPPRQVITRAIGFPFPEDPEYHCQELQSGDRLLLCSDGLWSMLDDEQIHDILVSTDTSEKASTVLVERANAAGGTDNITAVVVFFDAETMPGRIIE